MKLRTTLLGTIGLAAISIVPARAAEVPSGPPVFGNPLSITNPYHPFVVGRVKHLETQQGHTDAEDTDVYLAATRTFSWNGTSVACHILEETALEDGAIVEISKNYFAQADDGTVYYFGEVVDIYENGVVVGHGGSWLVGGPTQPGDPAETATAPDPNVFMPANPELGDVFKPEDLVPFVDETDVIVKVGLNVSTPGGHFSNCIQIDESSQLSPATETKWYAPGLGVVKVKERGEVLVLDAVSDP